MAHAAASIDLLAFQQQAILDGVQVSIDNNAGLPGALAAFQQLPTSSWNGCLQGFGQIFGTRAACRTIF